jgi:nucleotide-binding universal stress UspA family protein
VIEESGATAIGLVLALAYAGTIGSILWWMLHVPKVGDVEQHAKRITRQLHRFARIVVPVQGDVLSDRLVALASQMAKYRRASMDVLYVIEVPYTLPITAAMEDQERHAREAFARAEKIADRYDVKIHRQIERARHAGPAIVQYARQTNADLLLMGDVPKSNRRGGTKFARSVEYVFENAPCEVMIDRPQME